MARRECCTATVDGNDAEHVTGPINLVPHHQAASVRDLNAQADALGKTQRALHDFPYPTLVHRRSVGLLI